MIFDSHRHSSSRHLFSHKSRMCHTCTLHSKCLKEDESLEKFEVADCKNIIHPSCRKNLITMFGEDSWEGPLFCGKCCYKHQNKAPKAASLQTKICQMIKNKV